MEEHTTGTECEEAGCPMADLARSQRPGHGRGQSPGAAPLLGSETPRVCVRLSLPASAKLLVGGVT